MIKEAVEGRVAQKLLRYETEKQQHQQFMQEVKETAHLSNVLRAKNGGYLWHLGKQQQGRAQPQEHKQLARKAEQKEQARSTKSNRKLVRKSKPLVVLPGGISIADYTKMSNEPVVKKPQQDENDFLNTFIKPKTRSP